MRDVLGCLGVLVAGSAPYGGCSPERPFKKPFVYGASAGTTWDVLGPQHPVRGVYAWSQTAERKDHRPHALLSFEASPSHGGRLVDGMKLGKADYPRVASDDSQA
jgi:hypothetical protein